VTICFTSGHCGRIFHPHRCRRCAAAHTPTHARNALSARRSSTRGCWGPTKLKNARTFLEHKNGCRCCHSSVPQWSCSLLDMLAAAPPPDSPPPDCNPPVSPAAQLAAQPIADCAESVGLCQYFTVSTFCSSMLNILLMLKRQFLFNVALLARCATATSSGSRTFSMNPSRFHAAQDMAMQW
jgi:hypothetical protein